MSLEDIITHGTTMGADKGNIVTCADGFQMSVIANWGAYCTPRPSNCRKIDYVTRTEPCGDCKDYGMAAEWGMDCGFTGPFTACEMGFPTHRPEPWDAWQEYADNSDEPTSSVYPFVPVVMLRELVALHGGER